MKNQEEMKSNVFRLLCNNDVCIMNPGYVLSTCAISKILNISYYFAKKFCKQLEAEGLIEYKKEYIPAQFDMKLEWNYNKKHFGILDGKRVKRH